MNAADVMTRNVLTVLPSDSIELAARLMLDYPISGLPVVDSAGAVRGMITEGDLLKRTEVGTEPVPSRWRALWLGPTRLAERYVHSHGRTVEEIMTPGIISVTEQTPLAQVVALMESRNIKRVAVLRDQRLVGIISRADLLRALERLLPASDAPAISDAAIRAAILQELRRQAWVPREYIDVSVENGTVELRGVVTSQPIRDGLRVLAENTPGVKRVVDQLIWIEPYTGMTVDSQATPP
ncbi:MAG TPA: CBS domain-containing protein [Steroidobacteraceae bacterium]|nr:CBS domain-containing protein [Steroidobacteraceae bacterium]